MTAAREIVIYSPFEHYLWADITRLFLGLLAFMISASMLYLARVRWGEDRRSASLFLVGLASCLMINFLSSIYGLGHPPTYILYLRFIPEVIAVVALRVVVSEARRGVWARRPD